MITECIDASSDYCPCYLAEVEECLSCSLLNGEKTCNCTWTGTCKFNEFLWAGKQVESHRKTILCKILEKKMEENLLILTLKVPHKTAVNLKEPGSYIFIRTCLKPSFFDLPLAVMCANEIEDYIIVTVDIKGPKTKALQQNQNVVYLRYPYYNGIFGLKQLKKTFNSNCLVILGGIAQASGVMLIDKLIENKNNIVLLIDRSYPFFIKKYIADDVKIYKKNLSNREGEKFLQDILFSFNIDFIYIGGCGKLQENVLHLLKSHQYPARLTLSNNNRLCCGEGICGSCEITIKGQRLRTCKEQFNVDDDYD
ncbi:MAG: hypothetical protein A4E27_00584 [Methanobacterium sp. PtaU1.Bin242]|nr:MAG: hypothetical protein A4E27_00584 [Methanobacterium sp. PtaU1.Bin242]